MFSSTFFSAIFSPSIGRLIIGSRLLTKQALAAERRMQAQEAARKASVGALGGARFRDTTTIGGGPTGPTGPTQ